MGYDEAKLLAQQEAYDQLWADCLDDRCGCRPGECRFADAETPRDSTPPDLKRVLAEALAKRPDKGRREP